MLGLPFPRDPAMLLCRSLHPSVLLGRSAAALLPIVLACSQNPTPNHGAGTVPAATGGAAGGGGASAGATAAGGAGTYAPLSTDRCLAPELVWRTGQKTTYTSYPDPGSEECVAYNGCTWAGQFAHCSGKRPESWVASRDIAAVFPDTGLARHDLCLRSGDRLMVVTAIDTCGDSDCDGCCTRNKGQADALVDLESHTDARWGLPDGAIEWADLGLNPDACAE